MFLGLNLCNVGFVGALTPSAANYSLQSAAFGHLGANQTWVVPANVYSVTGRLWGSAGALGSAAGVIAGEGHYVAMGFNVTPGNVLTLRVGGPATDGYSSGGLGGTTTSFNGGNGGGRSQIFHAGIVLVAGGGGGAGDAFGPTPVKGGAAALSGKWGGGFAAYAGKGGMTGAGGLAGLGGVNGAFGQGGNGGAYDDLAGDESAGGGGGDGYYGGGGGGAAANINSIGGGGGGSSFCSGGYNVISTGVGANWADDPYWASGAASGVNPGRIVLTYWG